MRVRAVLLGKHYKVGNTYINALRGINIDISGGEVCCIVGPSGSGKTTLLNQLAGLEKPSKGRIYIGDTEISSLTEAQLTNFRRDQMGFVFQNYNLLPELTAMENVALPLVCQGVNFAKRNKSAKEQLRTMDLYNRRKHLPRQLSGGQQQRVAIARAFISKPSVVYADEPTGNLDSKTKAAVLKYILDNAKRHNSTLIIVTHENEIARCGNRLITIGDGAVLSDIKRSESDVKEARQTLFAAWEGGSTYAR